MPKHVVKVLEWSTGMFQAFRWIYGTRWNIDFTANVLALPMNTPYKEYDWNMLEQYPEEMGVPAESFRIPNGKHLHPVDAYSVDGVLVPFDKTYLPNRKLGVWIQNGIKYINLGPGESYHYDDPDGSGYLCTSEIFPFPTTTHYAYGMAGWAVRDSQGFMSYERYALYQPSRGGATWMQKCTGIRHYVSIEEWRSACQSGSIAALLNGATASWESQYQSNYPTQVLEYVPPVAVGYFDDLISQVTEVPWAQIARDAYNNIEAGFDGNGIALVSDLTNSVSSARDTVKAVRGLAGNRKANALASLYLSFRYGWKLLMSDVKSLSKAMRRNVASRFTHATAMSTTTVNGCECLATYQVFYDKYGGILGDMSALDQLTNELDLEMSLGNIWDMVKYSFVLDWFADVGSVLESMDSFYNVAYRYKVLAAGKSLKVSRKRSVAGFTGSVNETAYRRRYAKDAIPPSPLPATHQPRSQSWIDGAALVVQRL